MSFELNQDIEATAFAGEVRTEIVGLRTEMAEVRGDVKHIRSQLDKWGGAIALIGAVVSAAVSFAVAIFQ